MTAIPTRWTWRGHANKKNHHNIINTNPARWHTLEVRKELSLERMVLRSFDGRFALASFALACAVKVGALDTFNDPYSSKPIYMTRIDEEASSKLYEICALDINELADYHSWRSKILSCCIYY